MPGISELEDIVCECVWPEPRMCAALSAHLLTASPGRATRTIANGASVSKRTPGVPRCSVPTTKVAIAKVRLMIDKTRTSTSYGPICGVTDDQGPNG